jgi:hypothetical protein
MRFRRVPVRIVHGWIVASPLRASWSSNAFVKPWTNMSAMVRRCRAQFRSASAALTARPATAGFQF